MAEASTPVPPNFPYVLVVQDTFKGYKRGDVIEDPAEIAKIMDTHHESFVTKRAK